MKRHVFTLSPLPEAKAWTIRVPELVHQIVRVLHLRTGEEILLVDGQGKAVVAEIVAYSDRTVDVRKRAEQEAPVPTPDAGRRLFVCASILKKDHFEWLTEKLAEIGITDLVPLLSARTIKKDLRLDRLKTIAQEAMEQSQQARVMTIHPPIDLQGACQLLNRTRIDGVVCDTGKGLPSLEVVLSERKTEAVFVGPEGGWSDEERVFFEQECRYPKASLGTSVLRGETAGILAGFCLARCAKGK